MDPSVHALGEVDAEKRQRGVGHRIDQTFDEMAVGRRQLVELAPEGNDSDRGLGSEQTSDTIALQARAVHGPGGVNVSGGCLEDDFVRPDPSTDDGRMQTHIAHQPGQREAHRGIVGNSSTRDVQRGLSSGGVEWVYVGRGLGGDLDEAGGLRRGGTGTSEVFIRAQSRAWLDYMNADA